MSTVTGLYPNAITPTVNPFGDMAQRAQQRRDNDAAVFAPVEEAETTAPGQNRPDRSDRQTQPVQNNPSASPASVAQAESQAQPADETPPAADDTSAFARQRDESRAVRQEAEQRQLDQDLQTIRELAARDREVRSHEQAHQAVGGQYAGGMSLSFERGPDGKRYAVAGEVPIDISSIPGNPEATMAKAEQVRRAALAPAEPSAQDRSVAAAAMQLKMDAQIELRQEFREDLSPQETEAEGDAATATDRAGDAPAISGADRAGAAGPEADEATERASDSDQRSSDLAAATRGLLDAQYQAQARADTLGRQLDFMV
ncbi:putative metalloprotease CJM1_0395 family protein [Saccharospirillum impatiens]|uniref:putative metalloprotease CJM1_0395 family protein n=1 Tax=Saccharospirillum impatiens TaxID=169438 RepID=UPI00041260CD|nr:putative metalloprotease CJM1_0395 family protein [Saccharospirillum impatiens]